MRCRVVQRRSETHAGYVRPPISTVHSPAVQPGAGRSARRPRRPSPGRPRRRACGRTRRRGRSRPARRRGARPRRGTSAAPGRAQHLHEPARSAGRPALRGEHGVAADEAAGLSSVDREAEPGLEHGRRCCRCRGRSRGSPSPSAGWPAPSARRGAGRTRAPASTSRSYTCSGLLGRHVELVAELAEVGDAHAQHAGEADVDLARGAERERLVRQVGAASATAAARASAGPAR